MSYYLFVKQSSLKLAPLVWPEGSATSQESVRDFEISGFQYGFQDFTKDFKISAKISRFQQDFKISVKISRFHEISRKISRFHWRFQDFTEDLEISLGAEARDFAVCHAKKLKPGYRTVVTHSVGLMISHTVTRVTSFDDSMIVYWPWHTAKISNLSSKYHDVYTSTVVALDESWCYCMHLANISRLYFQVAKFINCQILLVYFDNCTFRYYGTLLLKLKTLVLKVLTLY